MVTLVQLRVIDAVGRHGSVTAAARELRYSQPSVSHHLARLESETGAQLLQRVGRGIRLTQAGELLARRSAEIIGRVESAAVELSDLVGLRTGRVRLAGFGSVMASLVPRAVGLLTSEHPDLVVELTDVHPDEALRLLRAGQVDVAVVFRHDDDGRDTDLDGVRSLHLLDDPLYLLTRDGRRTLDAHRDSAWIGGCPACRDHQSRMCAEAGFAPRLQYTTDDMVVMQQLVAAGLGVTTIPGLALAAHRHPGVTATLLPQTRRIHAVTYGEPPEPPPVAVALACLVRAATDETVGRAGGSRNGL